jgi:hypothetical protein
MMDGEISVLEPTVKALVSFIITEHDIRAILWKQTLAKREYKKLFGDISEKKAKITNNPNLLRQQTIAGDVSPMSN